jgi:hypothetical protein
VAVSGNRNATIAHRVSEAGKLLLGLSLGSERHQNGRDLRLSYPIADQVLEKLRRLLLRQVRVRYQFVEQRIDHEALEQAGSFKKFLSNVLPTTVMMDSG